METFTYQVPKPQQATPTMERKLFTVDEFVQLPEFSFLTASSLRHLIFNSRPRYSAGGDLIPGNGLVEAGALVRIGRRVLISVPEFRAWTLGKRETISDVRT